jgi:hypothetical protein
MKLLTPQFQKVREQFWTFIHARILFKNLPIFLVLVCTGCIAGLTPMPYSSFLSVTPTMVLTSTTLMVPLVVLVLGAFFYTFIHAIDLNTKPHNTEHNQKMRDQFRATYFHLIILTMFTILYPLGYQNVIFWSPMFSQIISGIYIFSIFIIGYESWRMGLVVTGIHYSIRFEATAKAHASMDISSSPKS